MSLKTFGKKVKKPEYVAKSLLKGIVAIVLLGAFGGVITSTGMTTIGGFGYALGFMIQGVITLVKTHILLALAVILVVAFATEVIHKEVK